MRAPASSVSGWQETSGWAIVKRMSAKSPRARRSRMWRSVSSYGRRQAPRRRRRARAPAALACGRSCRLHMGDCASDEGGSDPRGRRAGGSALRGRARSRSPGPARCSSGCAPRRSTTSTSGCARGCLRCRSRGSSAPTARRSSAGEDTGRATVVDQPGDRARRAGSPSSASTWTARTRSWSPSRRRTSIRFPTGVSFEEAAAFPLVFETAYRMLVTRAGLQRGRVGAPVGHRQRRRVGRRSRSRRRSARGRSSPRRATRSSSARESSAPTRRSTTRPATSSRR